jgi:ankyrin repeat protein
MKVAYSRFFRSLLLVAALPLGGCREKGEVARDELQEAGYQLTEADWFRALADDNMVALDHFIRGGIGIGSKNAEGDGSLHVAAAAGAQNAAKFLLDRKVEIDEPGADGRTPLMSAVRAGKADMVRWLLRQGANPKARDAEGFKPLMLAVKEGRAEVIGDLAASDREDLDGALLVAALLGQTRVIDELTKYGASVYARMDDGRTALMVAAENGHAETAALLIELGANRYTKSEEGYTAAELAQAAGHPEVADLLISNPTTKDFALVSDDQIAAEMTAFVDASTSADGAVESDPGLNKVSETSLPEQDTHAGGAAPTPKRGKEAAVSLNGQSVGKAVSADSPTAPDQASLNLVMRHYRQRELPVEVQSVDGSSARVEVRGKAVRVAKVSAGEMVPGSSLKVIRIQKRFEEVKDSAADPVEASVVEVEDVNTGVRRTLITGRPAIAHDPIALVEDAATGRRYLASPGQSFTGADGARYTVADVRPNQIVIENLETGAVQTLPLRGARG